MSLTFRRCLLDYLVFQSRQYLYLFIILSLFWTLVKPVRWKQFLITKHFHMAHRTHPILAWTSLPLKQAPKACVFYHHLNLTASLLQNNLYHGKPPPHDMAVLPTHFVFSLEPPSFLVIDMDGLVRTVSILIVFRGSTKPTQKTIRKVVALLPYGKVAFFLQLNCVDFACARHKSHLYEFHYHCLRGKVSRKSNPFFLDYSNGNTMWTRGIGD